MYIINELEIIKINENESVLINLINGNADLLNNVVAEIIQERNFNDIDDNYKKQLIMRKYAFENKEKYMEYINFINNKLMEESRKESPNFIYIPTFKCNLDCYYCFEKSYEKNINSDVDLNQNIDKLFLTIHSIIKQLKQKNHCNYNFENIPLTLTGGEPLLEQNHSSIEKIFEICNKEGFPISIVTNGTTIESYFDILKKFPVHEIQVTLDGGKSIHDKIRITHSGQGTFDIIVSNLQKIKKYSDKVSVRINITRRNIESMFELNDVIQDNPNIEFYVYIMQQEGCHDYENVIDELEALKYLYGLKSNFSILNNLYIVYHGRRLIDGVLGKKVFSPKIKMCSAMQNQYIIDSNGGIYKCWWGMGNKDYLVGKIDSQNYKIDKMVIQDYMNRTIYKLDKCKECKYRYLCGGGCSGRLTRSSLKNGDVMCPKFSEILNYVLPIEIKNMIYNERNLHR